MQDTVELTFVPGEIAPAAGGFALWSQDPTADLERAAGLLSLPAGEPWALASVEVDERGTSPVERDARWMPLLAVVRRLVELPRSSDLPGRRRPSASVRSWSVAAKLACEFVAAGRILPQLRMGGHANEAIATWRVAVDDRRITDLADAMPAAAHLLRLPSGEIAAPQVVLTAFLDGVADALARGGRHPARGRHVHRGRTSVSEAWAHALSGEDPVVVGVGDRIHSVVDEIDAWLAGTVTEPYHVATRLVLRLVEPPSPTDVATVAESGAPSHAANDDEAVRLRWRLMFALETNDEPPVRVDADDVWCDDGHERLGETVAFALDLRAELAVRLAAAARVFAPLDRALSELEPTHVRLDDDEAAALVIDASSELVSAGVVVELPPALRDDRIPRLRLRLRVGGDPGKDHVATGSPLGLHALASMRFEAVVGDEAIDADTFERLAAGDQRLVRWRGRWVRVDGDSPQAHERVGQELAVSLTEALAAALTGQHEVAGLGPLDVRAEGQFADAITRLRDRPDETHGGPRTDDAVIDTLIDGTLRDYQRRGVRWLAELSELGLGAVLADEMGLGKTVQAIALMAARDGHAPHLVVCPTTVVTNWVRELNRFAPKLEVHVHHGADRRATAVRRAHGVVVTSYALLRRDEHVLTQRDWDVVVFDEAQQIKNPRAKTAVAARNLRAHTRVAMTGTPMENRLSELWAVMDLTNPGLLGGRRTFEARFAVPIERWADAEAASRLRRVIAPFLLRRRKDDPQVAVDLPPKQELTVPCGLTREQASLYERVVESAFAGEGLGMTAFERRGRILALLTALKQICNHPAQYLRDDGALAGRSGKLDRVTDLIGDIVDAGDRVLVFTQFRAMGELVVKHLEEQFGFADVPFLHGGVAAANRQAMVDRFQEVGEASPLLVVSLRAGGTGVNLTRANHVVHLDRWWNPAVEDQATDRAHRIGQTRRVTVHTMVTTGTVEERIDELLRRKRVLADSVMDVGEEWITELGDAELAELVSLGSDLELADDDLEVEGAAEPGDPVPGSRPRLVAIDGGRA